MKQIRSDSLATARTLVWISSKGLKSIQTPALMTLLLVIIPTHPAFPRAKIQTWSRSLSLPHQSAHHLAAAGDLRQGIRDQTIARVSPRCERMRYFLISPYTVDVALSSRLIAERSSAAQVTCHGEIQSARFVFGSYILRQQFQCHRLSGPTPLAIQVVWH